MTTVQKKKNMKKMTNNFLQQIDQIEKYLKVYTETEYESLEQDSNENYRLKSLLVGLLLTAQNELSQKDFTSIKEKAIVTLQQYTGCMEDEILLTKLFSDILSENDLKNVLCNSATIRFK